ncbi:TPA: hypothetical protein ACOQ40_005324 [Bacillus cereus]
MDFLSLNEIKEIANSEAVDIIEVKVRKGVDDLPVICFKSDSAKEIAEFFMFARKANINTIFCYTETYEADFFRLNSSDINHFIDVDIIERETVLTYILDDIEEYNEQFDQHEEGEECNRVLFFYKDHIEHCIVLRKEWVEAILSREQAMFRILADYADELQALEEAWEEDK